MRWPWSRAELPKPIVDTAIVARLEEVAARLEGVTAQLAERVEQIREEVPADDAC